MFERTSIDPESASAWPPATNAVDREAQARDRAERAVVRATQTIPRLRALGYVGLFCLVGVHNELVFGDPLPRMLLLLGCVQLAYFTLSKLLLVRYYKPLRKFDLSDAFLAGDVPVFVMSVYASGGQHSWLLPVLCMRVADQVGTSPRRTLGFALLTAACHALLVAYLRWGEGQALQLGVESAKVLLVFGCNFYLALATAPGLRQRERAVRVAQTMRTLIEELQRKGAELEVQRERAESASRAKTVFLANMSHEIRTPLTAVLGMTDLLLRQRLDPAHREIVQTVQLAGKSLHALVNDVLDMSKVESGKLSLSMANVDLASVVQGAVDPLRVLAEGKRLSLDLSMRGLGDRKVRADALRLRQVISNLVGNAIKFTQSGSVQVRLIGSERQAPGSEPSTDTLGMCVQFAVQDTGIGIAKDAEKRVFEAFQQADESTTRNYGGTGLGLTISRKLVEMMGGELRLHSAPGQGSTFEFELRFLFAGESLRPASRADRAGNAARLRQRCPHVLVVEDIEVNRLLLRDVLQGLGCRVTVAEHGQGALAELAPDHHYDVVVMDWHMPVLDGLEATLRTRRGEQAQHRRRVPIIGFTASAFEADVMRCKQAGMDHVLHKPLDQPLLEEALWQCLGIASAAAAPGATLSAAPAGTAPERPTA